MDREYYVEIFEKADEYIVANPEVINWSVDIIFKKLDDGTKEMIRLRWGVMARAAIHSIHCFQIENLVNSLKPFSDNSYLCGFMGYLLQTEKKISLIDLLIAAYKVNCINCILPYAITHISYEKVFDLKHHDVILEIASSEIGESNRYSFLREYSKLIVEKGNVENIVDRYIEKPTSINESLIGSIAYWLFPTEMSKAKDIICKLGKYENQHFTNSIIVLLRQSVNYNNQCFDEFFDMVNKFVTEKTEFGQAMVSLFVAYLENANQGDYRHEVTGWLMKVQEGSLLEKLAFVNEFHFRHVNSAECKSIIRRILDSNFDKNEQILDSADMYLADVTKENYNEGINLLKRSFIVNHFNSFDSFFSKLPYTCTALATNRMCILEDAIENILRGSEKELYFAIQQIVTFYDISLINKILEDKKLNDQELIRIIEGVLLFAITAEKLCELTIELSTFVENQELYYNRCKDIVYGNYPGTLINRAKMYTDDSNDLKRAIAGEFLKNHEQRKVDFEFSYGIKDLWPSEKRNMSYKKAEYEQQRALHNKATSESVLMSIIKTENLKFGKRHAIIQETSSGEQKYQAMNFAVNEFELELPKQFMDHPVKQYLMKVAYLEGTKNDEISN